MVGFGGGYYADRAAYDRKHEEAVRAQHQLDHDNRLAQRMKEQREAEVMDNLMHDIAKFGGTPPTKATPGQLYEALANAVREQQGRERFNAWQAQEQKHQHERAETAKKLLEQQREVDRQTELKNEAIRQEYLRNNPHLSVQEIWNLDLGRMQAENLDAADKRKVQHEVNLLNAKLDATNAQANEQDIKDYKSFFAVPPTLDSKGRLTLTELKKLEDERERRRLSARDNPFSNLFDDDGKWTPGRPGAGGGTGTPGRPGAGGTNAPANTRVTEWVRDPKTGVLTPKR
jgi:hypothetical protein